MCLNYNYVQNEARQKESFRETFGLFVLTGQILDARCSILDSTSVHILVLSSIQYPASSIYNAYTKTVSYKRAISCRYNFTQREQTCPTRF